MKQLQELRLSGALSLESLERVLFNGPQMNSRNIAVPTPVSCVCLLSHGQNVEGKYESCGITDAIQDIPFRLTWGLGNYTKYSYAVFTQKELLIMILPTRNDLKIKSWALNETNLDMEREFIAFSNCK